MYYLLSCSKSGNETLLLDLCFYRTCIAISYFLMTLSDNIIHKPLTGILILLLHVLIESDIMSLFTWSAIHSISSTKAQFKALPLIFFLVPIICIVCACYSCVSILKYCPHEAGVRWQWVTQGLCVRPIAAICIQITANNKILKIN